MRRVTPPALAIAVAVNGDTMELKLRGVAQESNADLLGEAVAAALRETPGLVVLNCRRLTFLDIASVRALAQAIRTAPDAATRLKIVETRAAANELLRRTGVAMLVAALN
jgi:anti-anti-sigma factor